MEKFCQHIEKLLAHHDFVVIPGLGGFVVQTQSAQIQNDCITPPLANVGFNPLMNHSDGLLAIEISRSEKISYRMAMEYITDEVNAIRFRLNTNREVKLGNLGLFVLDIEENIQFLPSQKAEYLPHNLGLIDLHIQTVTKKENPEKITIQFKSSNLYKYAAVLLLLIGLFFTTNRIEDTRYNNTADFSSFTFLKSPETVPDSILSEKSDSIIVSLTENEDLHFHVIVASLAKKEVAEKFCQALIDKDFSTAKVLPPAKTYRVAIQSFSDRNHAIEYMENLRKTDKQFENAWVLCK